MQSNDLPLRSLLPAEDVMQSVTSSAFNNNASGLPVAGIWQPVDGVNPRFLRNADSSTNTPSSPGEPQPGTPRQVLNVSATESPLKAADGHIVSRVAVSFTPYPGDVNTAGVQVWFTGYNGSQTPTLMADGTSTPVSFTCETTHEDVTVTVVAIGPTGTPADFNRAPTCTVLLDGVNSAPPAPTIAQQKTALPSSLGWQFAWNAINGLEGDTIDGYWVYRSATSTPPVAPAGRFDYRKQTASNIGTYTFTDIVSGTFYYWVSAVNTSGLESSLASVAGHVATSIYPTSNSGGFVSSSNACDGNETTCAYGFDNDYEFTPKQVTYSGWTNPGGTPLMVTLKVMTQVSKDIGLIEDY